MAKLSVRPDPAVLARLPPDVHALPAGTRLWRVYFRGGVHPTSWSDFRFYGPRLLARFDHHQPPPHEQDRGILYAATGPLAVRTCLAEVYQEGRSIDVRHDEPWLAAFTLAREVLSLDLTRTWPTKAGASAALWADGRRAHARNWSCGFYEAYGQIEGLFYPSSMNPPAPALALYERAMAAIPRQADFDRPLADRGLRRRLWAAAAHIGYTTDE